MINVCMMKGSEKIINWGGGAAETLIEYLMFCLFVYFVRSEWFRVIYLP